MAFPLVKENPAQRAAAAPKLIVPDPVAEQLRCDLCHAYLSVPPITTHGDRVACGRCSPPGWSRNLPYERLAQLALLPCTYCGRRVGWEEAGRHEQLCGAAVALCPPLFARDLPLGKMPAETASGEYHAECQKRRVTCPFDYCHDRLGIGEVAPHFDKFHAEYIFPDNTVTARKILKEEKVWKFTCDNQVCLMLYRRMPFLLFVHSDCEYDETTGDILSYAYHFAVVSFCTKPFNLKYTATVTLTSQRQNAEYTMKNQEVKPFNEKLHLINFIRTGLVKQKSFNFLTTKFDNLRRSDDLVLTYTVKLQDTFDSVPPERSFPKQPLLKVGALLKSFECPICKEYLYAPVYNCDLGHSICQSCKSKMTTCPFCKAFIGNSRNFVLEDILETLQVACGNERKGCAFRGGVPDVRFHELTCVFNYAH